MQRLAPSLMPATRYVSKQLALIGRYFSIGETPIPGKTLDTPEERGEGGKPWESALATIEQGYPVRTAHQEIPVLEIKTAKPTLAHKQHTMPGPAFAFVFSQIRHFPAMYGFVCAFRLGNLFPPLRII
ncbi:diguanylate cyclase and metal dependent phosphohydrolase [Lasius niger]|uniref:Diguanylate cyclase and metal dependent phosphohydrolase n=1 Tax=Lasius niger TaxID=67767 RepID=A0A0J7L6R7_LASNI|nr:diguanylate cyclase and metal dependent phosphohydrolase [Lasius niger]